MLLTDSKSRSRSRIRNRSQLRSQQQKIAYLQTLEYTAPNFPICPQHKHQHTQLICISASCKQYLHKYCKLCIDENSKHNSNHMVEISHIVPQLSQYVCRKWNKQIQQNNRQIQKQWRISQYNVKYCIDILTQLHTIITQNRNNNRIFELPLYQAIIDELLAVYDDQLQKQVGVPGIQTLVSKFNQKYGLFQTSQNNKVIKSIDNQDENITAKQKWNGKFINQYPIDQDIKFRLNKWMKAGRQTKKFSQQALLFSQKLSQSIQSKLKLEKRRKNLEQLTNKKVSSLSQILKQYKQSKISQGENSFSTYKIYQKIEELPSLTIQLSDGLKKSRSKNMQNGMQSEQSSFIIENLSKFKNLKLLGIKNKNGKISHSMWQQMIKNFEYLKNLKQLRLTIRTQDLLLLSKLFKQRPNAVRHIPILHLTISDEAKLDLKNVAQFCNTLQLHQLYLNLPRNNIVKTNYYQFLNLLRYKTSLSYLPMEVLQVNLAKNKIIDQQDIIQCHSDFVKKYKQIKRNSIAF